MRKRRERGGTGRKARREGYKGCLSASKFKVPPHAARIKLTLQQATNRTPDHPIHPSLHIPGSASSAVEEEKTREGGRSARRCIATPAHILHLITFLKYDPTGSDVDYHPPTAAARHHPPWWIESVAPLRGGDELRRFAGQAPFYMQNFTGRGSEIANSPGKWSSPWKITRGISGPSLSPPATLRGPRQHRCLFYFFQAIYIPGLSGLGRIFRHRVTRPAVSL